MHHKTVLPILAIAALCLAGCSASPSAQLPKPQGSIDKFSNTDWSTVLSRVVTPQGWVRWDLLKNNEEGTRDALLRYVGLIAAASPANRPDLFKSDDQKLAYSLNAYNALCMYGVVQRNYPSNVLHAGGRDG